MSFVAWNDIGGTRSLTDSPEGCDTGRPAETQPRAREITRDGSSSRLNLRVGRIRRGDQVPREEGQNVLLDPLADFVRVVAVVLLVVVGDAQLGHGRMQLLVRSDERVLRP